MYVSYLIAAISAIALLALATALYSVRQLRRRLDAAEHRIDTNVHKIDAHNLALSLSDDRIPEETQLTRRRRHLWLVRVMAPLLIAAGWLRDRITANPAPALAGALGTAAVASIAVLVILTTPDQQTNSGASVSTENSPTTDQRYVPTAHSRAPSSSSLISSPTPTDTAPDSATVCATPLPPLPPSCLTTPDLLTTPGLTVPTIPSLPTDPPLTSNNDGSGDHRITPNPTTPLPPTHPSRTHACQPIHLHVPKVLDLCL